MENIADVLKKTPDQFAKMFIKKRFPKLADVEFEVKTELDACPECDQKTIVQYYVKRELDNDFRIVPQTNQHCVRCEDRRLAKEAIETHKRLKIERATSQFWIVPMELEKETLISYKPEDPAQSDALAKAVQYCKDFKSGDFYNLVFRGSYGGGKSHLLKGIADVLRKITKKDRDGDDIPLTVGFLEFEKLLAMIKGTWGRREGQTENEILKLATELDVLVIDDLGTESGEWAGKMLFSIVNGRLGKVTLYSTNFMEMDQLADRFGANGGKIVSRLYSNTKIVDLVTKDMRMKKQRG